MLKIPKQIWNSLEKEEKEYLKFGLILILFIGFFSILVLPFLFTLPAYFGIIDYSNKGSVGDTINGIAGPFIALLAAILTFLAFYIQYKANIQQRQQFSKTLEGQNIERGEQEKIWRIERFENRFYELLKLHKSNVGEMNISNRIFGRKCFVHMFYELKYCYQTVEDHIKLTIDDDKRDYEYDKINPMDFSYRVFFFGIGYQSERNFIQSLKKGELHLLEKIKPFLNRIQTSFVESGASFENYDMRKLTLAVQKKDGNPRFDYFPFDGHANRLGHYYRHLFQTLNYIKSQDFLSDDERYGYVKMIRAQLSNFEQLLLYYNSLAWFQEEWRPFLTDYRLIKNLPLSVADFYITPMEYFKEDIIRLKERGIDIFEY